MKSLLLTILFMGSLGITPRPASVQMSDEVVDASAVSRIDFVKDDSLAPEAYELHIKQKRIVVRSSDEAGRFYALKTLGQMERAGSLREGVIKDAPRFAWRGFMLDEARHFFGVEKVKQFLDIMAEYKLNKFHWHLVDNQGWRVEVKAYPQFAQIGAVGCNTDKKAPAKFYTHDQIREIVAYAAERHIEVIPEIDMPGHAAAGVRSIPAIDGGLNTYNPASEQTYTVLSTVIKELAPLFPSRWFHIGGDEVEYQNWPNLPEMQQFMKKENLKELADVQAHFGRRMADTVAFYGKAVAGWDDIAEYGLPSDKALVMWWQGDRPQDLKRDLAKGYATVICPHTSMYLDYVQEEHHTSGVTNKTNRIDDLYMFEIEDNPHICGVQANLWAETTHTAERLEYMVFPRLIALAELGWTAEERRDLADFKERLGSVFEFLDLRGIYYYDAAHPERHPEQPWPGRDW